MRPLVTATLGFLQTTVKQATKPFLQESCRYNLATRVSSCFFSVLLLFRLAKLSAWISKRVLNFPQTSLVEWHERRGVSRPYGLFVWTWYHKWHTRSQKKCHFCMAISQNESIFGTGCQFLDNHVGWLTAIVPCQAALYTNFRPTPSECKGQSCQS